MGHGQLLHEGPGAVAPAFSPRVRLPLPIAVMVLAVLAALAGASAVSAAPRGDGAAQPLAAADVQAGASVYTPQCAGCHGAQGEGASGPSLAAAAFADLVAPKVRQGGGGMPAFEGRLSAVEIADLSAFVAEELADPSAREAAVGDGGVVYRLYCAGCHGATGRGGALVEGGNAPSLGGKPAANALAAMIAGPKNMPVFTGTLDVRQQAAVARYIHATLVRPETPGGYGLGFFGPVAEGIVAWVGLAVLILIAVWLAWRKGGTADDRP